jgi:hypothetical protein
MMRGICRRAKPTSHALSLVSPRLPPFTACSQQTPKCLSPTVVRYSLKRCTHRRLLAMLSHHPFWNLVSAAFHWNAAHKVLPVCVGSKVLLPAPPTSGPCMALLKGFDLPKPAPHPGPLRRLLYIIFQIAGTLQLRRTHTDSDRLRQLHAGSKESKLSRFPMTS